VISYTTPGPGSQNTGAYISHATEKSRGAATILETVTVSPNTRSLSCRKQTCLLKKSLS